MNYQYLVTHLQRDGKFLGDVVLVEAPCTAIAKRDAAAQLGNDIYHNEDTIIIRIPDTMIVTQKG